MFCFFTCCCFSIRRPSCNGTMRVVSASQLELFSFAFSGFEENATIRLGKEFLNFEFLIANGMELLDQASVLVLAREAESRVNSINVANPLSVISRLFVDRAQRKVGGVEAAAAWWTMAFRFNQSNLDAFDAQFGLVEAATSCRLVQVGTMFGLWCPGLEQAEAPRIIAMTGFDGSLLTIYGEVCQGALKDGFSCLALMGPGQGETAVYGKQVGQGIEQSKES